MPALDGWFHAVVAGLFLYLPAAVLWRRGRELDEFGLRLAPLRRNLLLFGLLCICVFPLFALGFVAWQHIACAIPPLRSLAAGPCFVTSSGLLTGFTALRWPPTPLRFAAAELLVVALPEEMFFRGYVLGRLDEVWRPTRTILGAKLGPALLVSSALFALCHLAVQGHPATLAVFFPALVFGWLRERTGSVLAGTLFHAACNLYIEVLQRSFFG